MGVQAISVTRCVTRAQKRADSGLLLRKSNVVVTSCNMPRV